MSGNQALSTNYGIGGTPDISITNHGSDWYWAVCAVMTVATLVFLGLSFTRPRSHRIFHYITALITLVASIAYFSMGANLGQTAIQTEFNPRNLGAGTREIFYVRYIDWFVTTPLLLLDLLLTCGMPWPTIMVTIIADEVMIVTGLVGALTRSSYKWGYFCFGMIALLIVAWNLAFVGLKHARALGPAVSRVYTTCGVLTLFLWFLYPIAWAICEGANIIHPDSEAVFYGILDILAKPVFGTLLLLGHRNISPADLGLHIRDYDEVPRTGNYSDKHHNGVGNGNGVNTGVTTGTTGATTTAV